MAATHADRTALAANQQFIDRVTAAVLKYANTVGGESTGSNVPRAERRTRLIGRSIAANSTVGAEFARAAAGSNLADAAYPTAGTLNLAAVTDAAIDSYVAAAWDVIAGVQPYERGA